ncbi:MAG: hypothetical protein M0R02_14600, partial [Bacteroidales bacterium]|nr:hypothetical protein [Bacteroidales bacterium]
MTADTVAEMPGLGSQSVGACDGNTAIDLIRPHKKPRPVDRGFFGNPELSDNPDFFSLRPFLALGDLEFYPLA